MLNPGALRVLFSGALLGALALAACGGGGGSGATPPVITVPPPTGLSVPGVALVLKLPQPPSGSSAHRRPNYISAGTESIGVVVTNQGASPSASQYINVSSCPQVSGVTTCTITVQAVAGTDTFTITTYSGQNGTGSVLSTGTVTVAITFGSAPPPIALTLGGVVGSVSITTVNADLPLSQTMSVTVSAKDASGATIVGTYDSPIVLTGANLVLSKTSLPDSTTAANISVSWPQSYTGSAPATLTATGDGTTGTLTVTPASGFAYYTTGTNSANDEAGFKMTLGSDGDLYYTSLGPSTCNANALCSATAGGLHQFNRTTLTDVEVPVATEPEGVAYAPDGSVWFAGGLSPTPGASPLVYRMAPGAFSAASLTSIPVTGTLAGVTPNIRSLAADNLGNIWINDMSGTRYLEMPLAGPFTAASMTAYAHPAPPAAAPIFGKNTRTINFANGLLVFGHGGGYVSTVNPATGAVIAQYVTTLQNSLSSLTGSNLYDSSTDGTAVYFGQIGDADAAYSVGDLESFVTSGAFTTLPVVQGPIGSSVAMTSVAGGLVYYSSFGDVGIANPTSGQPRDFPIVGSSVTDPFYGANGMAALADGTLWFSCYGNNVNETTYAPICVGHTVYLSTWGLWPGTSIALNGAGAAGAQLVGIMEAPSANSGPFTVTSNNTAVCTVALNGDHNFNLTGVANGACTVTVTDAHSVSQAISVTVTTTSGTVQLRHRATVEVR